MRRDHAESAKRLPSQTGRGRPLGSGCFLREVEKLLGGRVRPPPIGRPRKHTKEG